MDSNAPYSEKDYEKAKAQGLDLDDWDDYARFYGLGTKEWECEEECWMKESICDML